MAKLCKIIIKSVNLTLVDIKGKNANCPRAGYKNMSVNPPLKKGYGVK